MTTELGEQAARRIFGQRAAGYVTSATHADPEVLARVVELSHPQADARALDVGTGTGHTALALAPHYAGIVGVDLTAEMLAEAGRLAQSKRLDNVSWCLADVHALPFADGVFARVTCRRAAHHFSDIARALAQMHRVLASAGRLVIDDRSVPEDDEIDALMNELDTLHDASHVRQYRAGEWAAMLTAAGFTVEAVEPYMQHRPLTSLTAGVESENVRRIHERLNGLSPDLRARMRVSASPGEPSSNHWYVIVAATRGGTAAAPRRP